MKPLINEQTKRRSTKTIANVASFKTLLRTLYNRPMTKSELMVAIGVCNNTASNWVNCLHRKPNILYISEWRRTGDRGCYAAVYAVGFNMPDAPKPVPLTSAQYAKRWRANQQRKLTQTTTSDGIIYRSK